MMILHKLADKDSGWMAIIFSMVSVVPADNPLGPANIALLLDDCPLPNSVRPLAIAGRNKLMMLSCRKR